MPVSGLERTVAYRELARGHDCLLQRPVTLYSLRQKFFSFVVLENVSFDLSRDSRFAILEFERAKLLVDNLPDNFVRHDGQELTAM